MKFRVFFLLLLAIACGDARADVFYFYGPHLTAEKPWINTISVFNNGMDYGYFNLIIWDQRGREIGSTQYGLAAFSIFKIIFPGVPGYEPAWNQVVLTPIEGTFAIRTSNQNLRPKLSYRYGYSESLCEFFLQTGFSFEYVLSNNVEPHFDWTGIAVMNPHDVDVEVTLSAYRDNRRIGETKFVLYPHTKRVDLSSSLWQGVRITDFDQIKVSSTMVGLPAPISITGNNSQTRHVFFNGASTNRSEYMDSIAGNFRLVHAGSFTQGSPREEFGHAYNEEVQVPWQNSIVPFTVQHVLTRDILVMETEVTQEMWANLKRVQTSLPLDPTQVEGRGPKFPVNSVTWFESILFANLLTLKAGLKPCYYTNSAQSALINSSNYLGGQYYFDINANGYRLPTEAEWEYFCRAGTATPFHIYEPYYDGSNWQRCKSGLFQFLERVATICDNNKGGPVAVGTRDPNPWGLYDVHGNVAEWCWDWHLSYPSTQLLNYYGPNSGSQRIIRGGGWFWAASLCRSAARGSDDPGIRNNSFGFRLVRTLRQNY